MHFFVKTLQIYPKYFKIKPREKILFSEIKKLSFWPQLATTNGVAISSMDSRSQALRCGSGGGRLT